MKIFSNSQFLILLLVVVCLLVSPTQAFAQNNLRQQLNELQSDSASLERAVRYLKNPLLKKQVEKLLSETVAEKRRLDFYPVDFYYLRGNEKNNYTPGAGVYLTLDQLVDSLQSAVELAKIMRINKIDFYRFLLADSSGNNQNDLISASQDNHFVMLDSFPIYRQSEFLKQMFMETVLSTDKKRSVEFIWGRSEDNDAFFSTRLTAYNGQFSVYPRYRTFIGLDTFRDKKSWFADLKIYRKPQYLDTLTLADKNPVRQQSVVATTINLPTLPSIATAEPITGEKPLVVTNLSLAAKETVAAQKSSKSFNVSYYDQEKGSSSYQLKYEALLNSDAIYDSLKLVLTDARFLKIEKNNLPMQKELGSNGNEIMNLSGQPDNHNRLNLILNTVEKNPDNRHSVEWITGRTKGSSTYLATVITAFDGQLTVFNNYKKIADRALVKDKNSWFNQLPVLSDN